MPLLPPRRALALAWCTLAALGLRARHATSVLALGGPEAALAAPLALARCFPDARGLAKRICAPGLLAAERSAGLALLWAEAPGRELLLPAELGRVARGPSAPLVAFARGPLALLEEGPALAIVGSRAAGARGRARARALARAAVREGITVVSGGAEGIDLEAHQAALAAGGRTVVVLGDPVVGAADERPARVRELAGPTTLTLSPHGPWSPRGKGLWASRNAVTAALADAVAIVEGRLGSGTLHTAAAAARIGLPVLAVPGDPDDEVAAAPNALLEQGRARPLLTPEDALRAVLGHCRRRAARGAAAPCAPSASKPAQRLLARLASSAAPLPLDEAARLLEGNTGAALAAVLELELLGLARREGACVVRG
jgi:DNA processing protein